MEDALALRPRLADWNLSHFLPVIERVFSEADIAGRHVRIEELKVNLGDIPLSDFENVAPARLYRELKEAVARAMASPFESRAQSEQTARVELIEWYLLRGSLPFQTASAPSFSLDALFSDLAGQDPAALARLVRKAGVHEHSLERMVYQLSDEVLRRLVAVLGPEHAALILAYMLDLSVVQREQAIAAVEEAEFDHLLWVLVFSYLVHEAGSQFNRKIFVQSLIRGFAEHQGLEYDEILPMLGNALARTVARRGLPSSLPAVIAELLHEADAAPPVGPRPKTTVDEPTTIAALDPAALAQLVRSRGASTAWLRELVDALDEAALVALLAELEPEQARSIVVFLFDVRDVHRAQPTPSGEPAQFDRLLWLLTLTWAVERSGSEFNRKAFLHSLLHRLAGNEGLDFAAVAAEFRLGLAKAALKSPLRSSLPAVLAAMLADLDRAELSVPGAVRMGTDPGDQPGFETILCYAEGSNLESLRALLKGIESLSDADRPNEETLRSVLLAEILSWNPGREMDRSFFERVLARSFPQPLPERIREALLAAVPETVSEFRAALLLPDPAPSCVRSMSEIVDALLARADDSIAPDDPLIRELEHALGENNDPEAVRFLLSDRRLRERLPGILSKSAWESLVQTLEPGRFHALREAEPVLASAWMLALPGSRESEVQHAIRVAALEVMSEGAGSVESFTVRVLQYLRRAEPKDQRAEARFLLHMERLAEDKGVASLRQPASPLPAVRRKPANRTRPVPEETEDPIFYIANAGLVLASPFLPHLFSTLGMMEHDEKGRSAWRNPEDSMRAVHILQYLADGRTSAPEPQLILNKILCGMPTAAPMQRVIDLTGRETEICGQLLHAMIANWPPLSNSTPDALRETFLQREGRLNREGLAWKLRVQRKTLDVLVGQIPWSFSTISHDWMTDVVHVTW